MFKLQAIFGQVWQMTPKWHWTLQGQMYPIYMSPVSLIPKFQSVTLYDHQVFEIQAILKKKVQRMTKNDLEPYKVKYPIHVLLVFMSPNFHSVSLYYQPFSK